MKNVFELKSSWDTFSEHHRTTNHFSHCTFVGSSSAWLMVDDVNWCRTRNNFLLNDWWISGAEQSCAIRVLFWMINSDPSPGLGAMELGTIIRWTRDIMINDLSICPHYNISDRRKVHSIIETSDRSVSSPWLYWCAGPRVGQLFPGWFITTILRVLFDLWLWAVFVIIVFFCFNCRHHPGRRMVNGHNRWLRSDWSL